MEGQKEVKALRILMLNNEFPPLGGGTGIVNYHMFKEFKKYDDLWVDLITSSRSRNNYETEQFAERIVIYKVPVDNRNIHHSTNLELIRYFRRGLFLSLSLIRQKAYDLSFAFAGVPAGAIGYALKKLSQLPYIVSLQGPDVPGFEARYNYLYPFLKPILRIIWRNAAVVLAISRDHQRLAHETMSDIEISIICNGVDPEVFHPNEGRNGPINILCVGRLIERKGQRHLLRTFAQICDRYPEKSLTLTLVGTGDARDNLEVTATRLGIASQVCFTGFVAKEEMPRIYQQADIFVLPSENEGMSIALLEAMVSGLPVIVTDVGGSSELIQPGENGFYVPWADEAALFESLVTLIEDPSIRARMGQNNRKKGKEFNWSVITGEYVQLFHKVSRRLSRGES